MNLFLLFPLGCFFFFWLRNWILGWLKLPGSFADIVAREREKERETESAGQFFYSAGGTFLMYRMYEASKVRQSVRKYPALPSCRGRHKGGASVTCLAKLTSCTVPFLGKELLSFYEHGQVGPPNSSRLPCRALSTMYATLRFCVSKLRLSFRALKRARNHRHHTARIGQVCTVPPPVQPTDTVIIAIFRLLCPVCPKMTRGG